MSRALALYSLREDAVPTVPGKAGPSLSFGREQFRFKLFRTDRNLKALDLDPLLEHANWGRSGGKLTGEVNFRRPAGFTGLQTVVKGDEVRCEVALWGSANGWRTLWKMEVQEPNHDVVEGILSMAIAVSLDPLTKSKLAWKFRKDRLHPRGWTADQITRFVCRRVGVKVGALPACTHRIGKLVEKAKSAYDVIVRAWKAERTETGRRFDVDFSTGVLRVSELREPRYMQQLGPAITAATVDQGLGSFATVIIATASRKATGGRKARKLRVRYVDRARRRRFGEIEKTVKAPSSIDSVAELRRWAKKELADTFLPRNALTISHPGIPRVDRGDAIRVKLPDADMNVLVFVTEARHDVSFGSYTMDLTLGFTDPYKALRAARVKKKKAQVAARRKRGTAVLSIEDVPVPGVNLMRED